MSVDNEIPPVRNLEFLFLALFYGTLSIQKQPSCKKSVQPLRMLL